jgi:hypothetical protein
MRRLFALVGFLLAAIVMAVSPAHASENITYQYDALGRLVAVSTAGTAPTSGQNVTTSFDPAGNRTNYTVNGVSGGGSTRACQSVAPVPTKAVRSISRSRFRSRQQPRLR